MKCIMCSRGLSSVHLDSRKAPEGTRFVCFEHRQLYDLINSDNLTGFSSMSNEDVLTDIVGWMMDNMSTPVYDDTNNMSWERVRIELEEYDYENAVYDQIPLEDIEGHLGTRPSDKSSTWIYIQCDGSTSEHVWALTTLSRMGYNSPDVIELGDKIIIDPVNKIMKKLGGEVIFESVMLRDVDDVYNHWERQRNLTIINPVPYEISSLGIPK